MSESHPTSELEARMWAEFGDEMRAILAQAPAKLTPDQIREIRAALLRRQAS